ncbi:hypothetical protein [Caproiciproducens faecalis]|uniref:Uncharacterized protein n=1 Tax=Caproiciproducens faecalis TaxID=2820301 RepID=A0ABS7DMZ8_9FIRM|nr:hypothetical protein [Caproiciproducens faecalis]MBW7572447.1 hypothetical protein [Caproiciproducens faecalis]
MSFMRLLLTDTAHFFIGLLGFLIYVGFYMAVSFMVNKLVRWCDKHIPFAEIGQFVQKLWFKVKGEEQ